MDSLSRLIRFESVHSRFQCRTYPLRSGLISFDDSFFATHNLNVNTTKLLRCVRRKSQFSNKKITFHVKSPEFILKNFEFEIKKKKKKTTI